MDPSTLQCVCAADFDAATGLCLPSKPVSDLVAKQATDGLAWRVMPVVDPPFVIKNGNSSDRPYSG